MTWLLDEWVYRRDLLRSKSDRYKVVDMDGVWRAASDITPQDIRKQDGNAAHMFQLGCRCLPTARAINLLNSHLPHEVYPGDACPFGCGVRGEEHHSFCACVPLDMPRKLAMEVFHEDVRKLVADKIGTANGVYLRGIEMSDLWESLFPDDVADFKWGRTPVQVRGVVHEMMRRGGKRIRDDTCAVEVKVLVAKLYGSVWDAYKKRLVDTKQDFKERLKATNDMDLSGLRKYTHRQRVASRDADVPTRDVQGVGVPPPPPGGGGGVGGVPLEALPVDVPGGVPLTMGSGGLEPEPD